MHERTGLWLVGAGGSVATTVSLGLAALQRGLTDSAGLVSALPAFSQTDLPDWQRLLIGGHEIRAVDTPEEAVALARTDRAVPDSLIEECLPELRAVGERIRPGILFRPGSAISQLADANWVAATGRPPGEMVETASRDILQFKSDNGLARVIVINLASTEPAPPPGSLPGTWSEMESMLDDQSLPVGSSTLYAVAAFRAGAAFVNFTPSPGSSLEALKDLACQQRVGHAGQDGKTGETLVKSALAPLFALRNLRVMSWVGHNIFGNRDARILDDPLNKQTKVGSKDGLLARILGYQPQTLTSIENISSLGEWKTAWDHIHFRGFLDTPMTMQFTWQGCDSILAAPLVLDLARFVDRAARAGQTGVLDFLSCFFKAPMTDNDGREPSADLSLQFQQLLDWAKGLQSTDSNS